MNAYQYKEGSLIIDLMDAEANALIWRGWAVAILEDVDPEETEDRLNKIIERIFEGLPASAGKSHQSGLKILSRVSQIRGNFPDL